MERVWELLYHGLAVLLFCIAIMLLVSQFRELGRLEQEAKKNIYDRHVLQCHQIDSY